MALKRWTKFTLTIFRMCCSSCCAKLLCFSFIILMSFSYAQGTLFCHECLRNEQSTFCNISSNTQKCSEGKEVCVTAVTNINGLLYSKKGCLVADVCYAASQVNPSECGDGLVTGVCTYCCIGDLCNYDRFRYTHTTPAPTTTTTMINLITTVAPPTCDSRNLTKCVSNYGDLILLAMANPRQNFPYFCRQVPSMFQCIANAMTECCPENQQTVQQKLNLVADHLWSHCPRDCDEDEGRVCTSTTVTNVITDLVAGNASCSVLLKEIHYYQTCLVLHVGTCGDIIRVDFENKVNVIYNALNVTCSGSDSTIIPPTESLPTTRGVTTSVPSSCDESTATKCLVSLAHKLTSKVRPEVEVVCNVLIPETKKCLDEALVSCPPAVDERIDRALNFTLGLAGDAIERCNVTDDKPLICDTTAARACALEIYDVIDRIGDYGLACRMVNQTKECVLSNVTGCTEREKVSINRTLELILQTLDGKCEKTIMFKTNCSDLRLDEGGQERNVTFKSNSDPQILCAGEEDCEIYVDLNFLSPDALKCRDGTEIEQVVCRPEVITLSNWACSVQITNNWKQNHVVHIAAKVDGKIDGDKEVEMTLVYRKVVNGQVKEMMTMDTCRITVIDHDTKGQCESINDPHIMTFDGVKYDNFYEGHFILYRHLTYPCEVQALYQRCRIGGFYGTCNCGVAVKSGDYVFFAESCRRRRRDFCGRGRKCRNLRAKSFVWDDVTDGTRIFRRQSAYEVWLPYGTRIKLQYYRDHNLINIWIVPSSADFMNTTGLCGFYDGSKEKDLRLPDGSVYNGRHVGSGQQPREFNKAWRLTNTADFLYKGAPYSPWYPPKYCRVNPINDEVECNAGNLVSTCDLDASGEIDFDELPGFTPDVESRTKREVDGPRVFDFDLDYEPPDDPSTVDRTWTESEARKFCRSYFDDSEIARICRFQVQMDIDHHVDICTQDIMLADDTTFAISAMEGLKVNCINKVEKDTTFTDTDTGRQIEDDVQNNICEQDCSNKGKCVEGKCVCNVGYVGPLCDIRANAVPDGVNGGDDSMCDIRRADCSAIMVYANDIIKSNKLSCHITLAEVSELGVTNTSKEFIVKANWISSSQVTCRMKGETHTGAYVTLSNDGRQRSSEAFLHVSRDAVCHDCQISEKSAFCTRKSDNCIVDGKCYGKGETLRTDACNVCDPSHSDSALKRIKNLACIGATVIIVAMVVVIFLIVIIAIIVMICCCKGRKKEFKPEDGVRHELIRKFRTSTQIQLK